MERFEDLTPGEQLYWELSDILDEVEDMPRKKDRETVVQRVLEGMLDVVRTRQYPPELQLRLFDDIDQINHGEWKRYTSPLRTAVQAALRGDPLPGK